jgi:hypothetical protein
MILFGEESLRRAIREYVVHYQTERNHQGVGNRLLESPAMVSPNDETIHCRERLVGMLNYYCRESSRKASDSSGTTAPNAVPVPSSSDGKTA